MRLFVVYVYVKNMLFGFCFGSPVTLFVRCETLVAPLLGLFDPRRDWDFFVSFVERMSLVKGYQGDCCWKVWRSVRWCGMLWR